MDSGGLEPGAGLLHRLTSYEVGREWDVPVDDPRVLVDFVANDEERVPWPVKRYDSGLPRVPLPRELPASDLPALAVLAAGGPSGPVPVDLAGLSRLLHLTAGVVRTMQAAPFGTFLFRAAGSAGGRFPLEFYIAVPEGSELPLGVHWYDPVEHALVQVGPAPRSGGAPTVVVTGVPWRTGWRYAERAFRHIYWDAGTALAQLLALSDSVGHQARLYTRFPDAGVSELIGIDGTHEWPVALVTFGDGAPAVEAAAPAAAGVIDADPLEFPLVTTAQRAGDMDHLGSPWPVAPAVEVPISSDTTVDEVIVRRGSQRRMDPSRGLPEQTLRTSLAVALRGITVEHWLAVHDVTGLASGIYRMPDLDKPFRAADQEWTRAELYRVCLDQTLGRDAAFVVMAATDVAQLSDREYREAQLAAGIVEGRLHLAAYALGAGATGMTFLDSEIPSLLSPESPHALLFTCVGTPANNSKPAGAPGAPTSVRRVTPRE
ncbi:MAG: SagB/ThcOx family dehydrogenase [Catenulispora sp.]|nr:SagB/ThcOx family dehydrogenase [Catenulispora sp.]